MENEAEVTTALITAAIYAERDGRSEVSVADLLRALVERDSNAVARAAMLADHEDLRARIDSEPTEWLVLDVVREYRYRHPTVTRFPHFRLGDGRFRELLDVGPTTDGTAYRFSYLDEGKTLHEEVFGPDERVTLDWSPTA